MATETFLSGAAMLARSIAKVNRPQHRADQFPRLGPERLRSTRGSSLKGWGLDQIGDDRSLVHAWIALVHRVANVLGRGEEWAHAAEEAIQHARLAGQRPARALLYLGAEADGAAGIQPTIQESGLRERIAERNE